MLQLVICVCLLAGIAGAESNNNNNNNNNNNDGPDPSKYLYTILRNKSPACIGTAIDDGSRKTTIVTAAHCVYNMQPSTLGVTKGSESKNVYQVLIHPYYMPPLIDYDIALIKIKKSDGAQCEKSKDTSNPHYLDISTEEPKKDSDNLFTVNWDWKSNNDSSPKTISITIEERKSCRAKLAKYVTVSNKMICANFQSAVVPDGSPLLYNNKLAGIASCGLQGNLPKIYTNIASCEIFSFIDMYL